MDDNTYIADNLSECSFSNRSVKQEVSLNLPAIDDIYSEVSTISFSQYPRDLSFYPVAQPTITVEEKQAKEEVRPVVHRKVGKISVDHFRHRRRPSTSTRPVSSVPQFRTPTNLLPQRYRTSGATPTASENRRVSDVIIVPPMKKEHAPERNTPDEPQVLVETHTNGTTYRIIQTCDDEEEPNELSQREENEDQQPTTSQNVRQMDFTRNSPRLSSHSNQTPVANIMSQPLTLPLNPPSKQISLPSVQPQPLMQSQIVTSNPDAFCNVCMQQYTSRSGLRNHTKTQKHMMRLQNLQSIINN